uniref:Uncharacterized protein n=1 Tax=Parascaris equorum TaxID=6256 RepID=A0A914RJG4_PAREQ
MSYIPTGVANSAAVSVSMSCNAYMATAAYFKNTTAYPTSHVPGTPFGFAAPSTRNFLPAGMGYLGGTLSDCQTALPWTATPPRFVL